MNFSKEELTELAEKMDNKEFAFLACAYLTHIRQSEIGFHMNANNGYCFIGRVQYLPERMATDKLIEYEYEGL